MPEDCIRGDVLGLAVDIEGTNLCLPHETIELATRGRRITDLVEQGFEQIGGEPIARVVHSLNRLLTCQASLLATELERARKRGEHSVDGERYTRHGLSDAAIDRAGARAVVEAQA